MKKNTYVSGLINITSIICGAILIGIYTESWVLGCGAFLIGYGAMPYPQGT